MARELHRWVLVRKLRWTGMCSHTVCHPHKRIHTHRRVRQQGQIANTLLLHDVLYSRERRHEYTAWNNWSCLPTRNDPSGGDFNCCIYSSTYECSIRHVWRCFSLDLFCNTSNKWVSICNTLRLKFGGTAVTAVCSPPRGTVRGEGWGVIFQNLRFTHHRTTPFSRRRKIGETYI